MANPKLHLSKTMRTGNQTFSADLELMVLETTYNEELLTTMECFESSPGRTFLGKRRYYSGIVA